MKSISGRMKNRILLIAITALALCLCCAFAACSSAQAQSSGSTPSRRADFFAVESAGQNADGGTLAAENYSRWLSSHYSAQVYTREMWFADLQNALGSSSVDASDSRAVFAAAKKKGLIDSADAEPYIALTRRFAAQTLVKALGYQPRCVEELVDLDPDDTAMSTAVYYGFFVPDDTGMVTPDAIVTEDEYRHLLDEVRCYTRLKGKTLLAFGDSIMYGMGNNDHGISDMIAEKYGMINLDYSISGATFGVDKGRSHIPNQIKSAAKLKIQPDIILIDGGTNDMEFVKEGEVIVGYQPEDINERTFAGGFEYSAYLLQRYWKDIPVIYIRAHDMDTVDDAVERKYGETALTIAEKWRLYSVDIYDDADLCTELIEMRDAYTPYKTKLGQNDGIHPTALGYAKFYIPLVSDKIREIM